MREPLVQFLVTPKLLFWKIGAWTSGTSDQSGVWQSKTDEQFLEGEFDFQWNCGDSME
jgi:hypothetical protein